MSPGPTPRRPPAAPARPVPPVSSPRTPPPPPAIRHERAPGRPGVELTWIDGVRDPWRGAHEGYVLTLLVRGRVEWRYRGRDLCAAAAGGGRPVLVRAPGDVHVDRRVTTRDVRMLILDAAVVRQAAEEAGGTLRPDDLPSVRAGQTADPALSSALSALFRSHDTGSPLERQERLNDVLTTLLRPALTGVGAGGAGDGVSGVARPAVRRAQDFLRAHARDAVSLDDVARAAGLSKYHLARAFAREVGMPPHAYQRCLRLARARRLLAAGCPVGAVAHETGFADQAHLTRWFGRVFGVTPGRYAAPVRGGSNRVQDAGPSGA